MIRHPRHTACYSYQCLNGVGETEEGKEEEEEEGVSRWREMVSLPGSPPSTLFCTVVRIVSPGVLIAAPNTPAQKP